MDLEPETWNPDKGSSSYQAVLGFHSMGVNSYVAAAGVATEQI